jgi:DNA-directed RNA polymerase subunit beta'
LKENIIIGHLIPAGTGHYRYVDLEIQAPEGFEPPPPVEVVEEAPVSDGLLVPALVEADV